MANNEFTIPIPARLKNVAKGGHVAGADQIIDDALGKEQSVINQEVSEAIEGNTEAVAAERQRAEAAEGALDNRLSDIEELAEISIDGGEAKIATGEDFHNPTAEQRAKVTTVGAILDGADNEPTSGSNNLVKSGGVEEKIENLYGNFIFTDNPSLPYYDVTGQAKYNTNRQKTFAIPVVEGDKFVISLFNYDNVYRVAALDSQKALIAEKSIAINGTWTNYEYTVPSGVSYIILSADGNGTAYKIGGTYESVMKVNDVDTEPTSGSNNLVKSGGVEEKIENLYGNFIFTDNPSLPYYDVTGQAKYNTNRQKTFAIPVVEGDKFIISLVNYSNCYRVAALDAQKTLIVDKSVAIEGRWTDYEYVVPSGVSYIILCSEGNASAYKVGGTFDSVNKTNDIDAHPTINSKKFIESGGVYDSIVGLGIQAKGYNVVADDFFIGTYWRADGSSLTNIYRHITGLIPVKKNDAFRYNLRIDTASLMIAAFDSDKNLILNKSLVGTSNYANGLYIVDDDVQYVQFQIYAGGAEDSYVDYLFNTSFYQENGIDMHYSDLIVGGRVYLMNGTYFDNNNGRRVSGFLKVNKGDIFYYSGFQYSNGPIIAAFDEQLGFLADKSVAGDNTHWQASYYTIPDGVSYIQYQTINGDYYEESYGIKQLSATNIEIADLQKRVVPSNGTKINGFSDFSYNKDWTISADGLTATTSATGYQKGLMYRAYCFNTGLNRWYIAQTNEDKWNISAIVKPVGTTFEVAIGKWYPLSNIIVSLKYDGTNSKVCMYVCGTDLVPVLKKELPLTNVSLESGKSYGIRVEKRLDITCVFNIYVTDEHGNMDTFEEVKNADGTCISWGWGTPCVYLASGDSLEVTDFNFGLPIEGELKVISLGHSWMEASTMTPSGSGSTADYDIADGYMYRVINAVGQSHGLNLGRGGENAGNLVEKIKDVILWFGNARYCIINIGGNDYAGGFTPEVTAQLIERCEHVKAMLLNSGITPIWIVDDGWYVNTAAQYADYNTWLLSQPYHVDVRNCFYDDNGVKQQSAYLDDLKHPTPETHEKIFNCIKAQAPYIFNI